MLIGVTPLRAQCTSDIGGADDLPGQKDLSQFCLIGTCNATDTSASWNFDDTAWSGNNTGDSCTLFDTDGDGSANRAVCVTVEGTPAQLQAGNPKCYTCADTAPDRCPSSVLVACTSTCSVTMSADPFTLDPNHVGNACSSTAGCPNSATCCRSKDAQATCCLTANDAGVGGVLIDVCSYPSQQPNSAPSDCVINRQCSKNDPNDPACDDHNPCTVDSCDTTFGACRHVAGNQGATCRSAAGACDAAEVCTGSSINCPPDEFAQGGICRNASDLCDVAESCDGTSAACPPDGVKPQGTVCRAANGNVCDVAEVCDGVSKTCPSDGSQSSSTPCDDGNACTTGDHCDGAGGCAGGPPPDCSDGNACTTDGCNPATGCTHTNNNDPCSDGSECTTGDTCSGGACVGGPPPNCNDGNVCTNDACNPSTPGGCTHTNNSNPCSDGSECTTGDTCSGGSCVGGPAPNCDDANACTTDACDPGVMGGCTHDPVPDCCNLDSECADTDECTTSERCVNHACVSDPVDCDDDNGCTDDSCNSSTLGGCVHVDNSDPCSDGSECTTNDTCSGGSCVGGPAPNCNDGNICTDDDCNPTTPGGCVHANNVAPCSDGSECTTNDHCSGGGCVGGPPPNCEDGNVCTNDACNPSTPGGCTHTNNSNPCSDGSECTTNDHCSGGGCVGGPPPNCNDNNVCTDDDCDAATPGGCTHTNNTDPCSDGSECTTNDHCSGGGCVGGPPPNCNDNNVCTDDGCDAATPGGCTHTNNTAPCSDGSECTTNDHCSGGGCVGGPPPSCNDSNPCTDEACDPLVPGGCTHTNNTNPCQDGNPCTENDACSGGLCQPGPQKNCNDLNLCTDDSCDATSGDCQHVDNSEPCNDGNVCTLDDMCFQGSCQPGPENPCNDGNFCTDDSCTPTTDCQHMQRPDCCNEDADCLDTDACTINERCVGHACASDPVNCDDGDQCTVDTCSNAGGGFVCDNTPCAEVQGQPCPDPSCFPPPPCGNGTVDAGVGETCDPPGSTIPQFPGVTCRDDCTYCGDNVVQPEHGETCDDGNKVEGCVKNDSFPIDDCQNNCTPHVCRDPTKAMLKAYIDKFTFHGRLARNTVVDFSSRNFTVELKTLSGRVLYRTSLPAGRLTSVSGGASGPFKYTSRSAKLAGGIAKVKIRAQGTDFYRVTVVAYGNLLASRKDMRTHIHAGNTEWSVMGAWQQRGAIWRFSPVAAN